MTAINFSITGPSCALRSTVLWYCTFISYTLYTVVIFTLSIYHIWYSTVYSTCRTSVLTVQYDVTVSCCLVCISMYCSFYLSGTRTQTPTSIPLPAAHDARAIAAVQDDDVLLCTDETQKLVCLQLLPIKAVDLSWIFIVF